MKQNLQTFALTVDDLLELKKPLYGRCNVGNYWAVTIDDHLIKDLEMSPTPVDLSLYVKRTPTTLKCLGGTYVDDCLNASTEEVEKLAELTLTKFDSKPRVYNSSDYYGTEIATIDKSLFLLSQKYCARNMPYDPKNCFFTEFRRYRALFSCFFHT